jgi:hypothetical protein
VCELLEIDTNRLKTELVQAVFNEAKMKAICGIAVCPRSRSEKLA